MSAQKSRDPVKFLNYLRGVTRGRNDTRMRWTNRAIAILENDKGLLENIIGECEVGQFSADSDAGQALHTLLLEYEKHSGRGRRARAYVHRTFTSYVTNYVTGEPLKSTSET